MKLRLLTLSLIILIFSCKKESQSTNSNSKAGEKLLLKAIQHSGEDVFNNSKIKFQIKDLDYTIYRHNNVVDYTLLRAHKGINYKGTYNNGLLQYFINDTLQPTSAHSKRFLESRLEGFINQFSVPHLFNHNSVHINKEDNVIIDGIDYYTLNITFTRLNETDPEDGFVIYINPETYYVDYYVEKQSITGEVVRFRKAINTRVINGLKISDFIVYSSKDREIPLTNVYKQYLEEKLVAYDTTRYNNITVTKIE